MSYESFQSLLKRPEFRVKFRDYLQTTQSLDVLLFWEQADMYCEVKEEERDDVFQKLVAKFLLPSASSPQSLDRYLALAPLLDTYSKDIDDANEEGNETTRTELVHELQEASARLIHSDHYGDFMNLSQRANRPLVIPSVPSVEVHGYDDNGKKSPKKKKKTRITKALAYKRKGSGASSPRRKKERDLSPQGSPSLRASLTSSSEATVSRGRSGSGGGSPRGSPREGESANADPYRKKKVELQIYKGQLLLKTTQVDAKRVELNEAEELVAQLQREVEALESKLEPEVNRIKANIARCEEELAILPVPDCSPLSLNIDVCALSMSPPSSPPLPSSSNPSYSYPSGSQSARKIGVVSSTPIKRSPVTARSGPSVTQTLERTTSAGIDGAVRKSRATTINTLDRPLTRTTSAQIGSFAGVAVEPEEGKLKAMPLHCSLYLPENEKKRRLSSLKGFNSTMIQSGRTLQRGSTKMVRYVRAVKGFKDTDNAELGFKLGNIIEFLQSDESGWGEGEIDGKRGWFPLSHVAESQKGVPDEAPPGWLEELKRGKQESVDVASILLQRQGTLCTLETHLGNRPEAKDLTDRHVLQTESNPIVGDVHHFFETKVKSDFLAGFFGKRKKASHPTSHPAGVPVTGMSVPDLNDKPFEEALTLFNQTSVKKGVAQLAQIGKFSMNDPMEVATFFMSCPHLDKTSIGEYVSERDEFNCSVLVALLSLLNFTNLDFDVALRRFLYRFRLPGEAQKIDRVLEAFAKQYCETNSGGPFSSQDAVFILSFSVIMLNTDAHNPAIKQKMCVAEFINNNKGINDGKDLNSVCACVEALLICGQLSVVVVVGSPQ
eukprot:TRINITY_DN2924_c0_g1_i1.p1 TRINITY_DN2924_c0_g1~~TRINITY_DN2924_c0_g1_i1.p1  ORF type:complete len:835 (+),score=158.40 TRINITY_DN2924_c0_g1_i1:360-2864(+)